MKAVYLNPLVWIATILIGIGMGLSYAIGSWIFCPLLSALERTKTGLGLSAPIFLILFCIFSPILFILSLETLPERLRCASGARAATTP